MRVMRLRRLVQLWVAFLPCPTRLIAEAIHDREAERAAVIFYGASLLAISLLLGALWCSAARNRDLLRPEVSEEEVGAILRATTPSIGFYVGFLLLALAAPRAAAFGYLLVAVVGVLRARGDEASPQTLA